MKAIDLYAISRLFTEAIAAAGRRELPILIVSSKYGLVDPDEEIESYEADLKEFTADA